MDGVLLWDKEKGPTSHDVVAQVRSESCEWHIGHAGTLDPAATGLLVLVLGRALKCIEFMEGHDKEYEAAVRLGRVTETDDSEGKVVAERDASRLTRADIEKAAPAFVGEIRQKPPAYSAIRIQGRRLYEYARQGQAVEIPERTVRVYEMTLIAFEPPMARFRIRCSKGTYIRSLARDLGEALGCGGSVEELRRTASGPFRVEQAVRVFDPAHLKPVDQGLAHLPEVRLTEEDAARFVRGRGLSIPPPAAVVRVYGPAGFLGIGGDREGKLWPRKVLG